MRKNNKLNNGKKCGTKNRSSFREFWTESWLDQRQHQKILAYASTLTNNLPDAEDLLQEIYLRALKYAPNPSGKQPLLYMKGMIRHKWIDSRQPPNVSLDEVFEKDPNNPALLVDDEIVKILETQEYLEILSGLASSPKLKLTIVLFTEGHDWQAIAMTLGENVRTTKFRWYTFCARVRRNFERLGITIH